MGSSCLHLVATIGPASSELASALATAGVTTFRLNASHLTPSSLTEAIRRLSADAPGIPIVVDLQGAKMRIGEVAPRVVATRESVRLALAPSEAGDVPVPHPEFFSQAVVGDTLSLDDGRLRLAVLRVGDGRVEAEALNEARLLPRKGLNVEQHPVRLHGLTRVDREICETAAALGVTRFAFSFILDGEEAAWVRAVAPGCRVVGKIERLEGAERIGVIARATDEVWVCRGDLGAQLGPVALGRFVSSLDPRALDAPVLMAGQVFEHLTHHPDPTRSELCHLFDLVQRGYAGIVLSDETAIGCAPVQAVTVAARLLRAFAA